MDELFPRARSEAGTAKNRIIEFWNSKDISAVRGNRKKIIEEMSKKFNLPENVIEKEIAEWEAGKAS